MKDKFIYCINFIWSSFAAFSFPMCFACIFLDITGHGKGYRYDLGSERSVSVMVGFVELIVWLTLALPSNIYVFSQAYKKGTKFLLTNAALYILLSAVCVYLMGGWVVYSKEVFNIQIMSMKR